MYFVVALGAVAAGRVCTQEARQPYCWLSPTTETMPSHTARLSVDEPKQKHFDHTVRNINLPKCGLSAA
jgi:hypothetical protein